MRIDLYNTSATEIATDPNAKQVTAQNLQAPEAAAGEDRTTLSSGSSSVSSLVADAMNSPEVRTDKVQSLQHAISSGQYQLDPDKIAGAMIDEQA
jgi:flagellar biosynthesis anti-sigma factor FlgM